jgi:hypothetical protein
MEKLMQGESENGKLLSKGKLPEGRMPTES